MDVKATLVTKTSKTGNLYDCIELELTPTYKKLVFLDTAEKELLALNNKDKEKEKDYNSPFMV